MKLKEAQAKIKTICNIPFADIFEELDFPMIIKNKGKTGQLLEMALGKKLDNANIDFEDGVTQIYNGLNDKKKGLVAGVDNLNTGLKTVNEGASALKTGNVRRVYAGRTA